MVPEHNHTWADQTPFPERGVCPGCDYDSEHEVGWRTGTPAPYPQPKETPMTTDDAPSAVAQVVATMRDTLAPIQEAAIGYRQRLIGAGFDPDAASMMASEFHHACFEQVLKGIRA